MAWNSTQRGTNKNCFIGVAMKLSLVVTIWLCLLLTYSCSKRTDDIELSSKNRIDTNNRTEHFSFNTDTMNQTQTMKQPTPLETLIKVFPRKILDFELEKTNKGTLNYSNILVSSASAEYLTKNSIIIIYIYDYIIFSNLPTHLKNLFELSQKDEIITINNGVGRFSTEYLSNVNSFDFIWNYRFHIKIEAINYPEFREGINDIINSLNLKALKNSFKVTKNE